MFGCHFRVAHQVSDRYVARVIPNYLAWHGRMFQHSISLQGSGASGLSSCTLTNAPFVREVHGLNTAPYQAPRLQWQLPNSGC
jgi:hypothetical protein